MIRQAMLADLPALQAMFATFVTSAHYAKYVGHDPEVSRATIARLLTMPDAAVFVVEAPDGLIGMLGIGIFPQPWSGERVAMEAFWWLDPARRGYGVYLLKRAERWAQAHGAVKLAMMAPADKPRVAEIYEALGYDRVEITYQKDLR